MNLHEEPCFLLESLSRWDLGWRLSQTGGAIILPVPQDFHTPTEAMHHVKRLSGNLGCTVVLKVSFGPQENGPGVKIIEISRPAATPVPRVPAR
jgi:hypothetical protein